ncbi:hypothetical protein BN946_scf184946.g13 [Trametes cinnabarina]|uniref:Mitochondrial carrier protein n=1 Tax=Pycnoporus cinnabarinus TaxID=5643 RepID=A0A060ST99_PYCCI|nr:hypothetical protein BN946_scf184946.g13 [Trametes cinnabarina]
MTAHAQTAHKITITPLDEKVAVLEDVPRESQYGLKFVGAAIASPATATEAGYAACTVSLTGRGVDGNAAAAPGAQGSAFWSIGIEMARKEGVLSLMGGLSASMVRELVYSGIRMGTYEYFKDKLHAISKGALSREGLLLKIGAASIAATIGSALANPADLVKVRMQAYYPDGSPYRNMRHAFASIYREGATLAASRGASVLAGGLGALYRGVEATTIRGIVLSATQICSYDQIKQSLKKRGMMQEGVPLHLVASTFAGLFCSITSNPVDVVKVRLMNDKKHEYKGTFDCVRQILVKEGPFGFYKGFGMCWARLGTHTILTFLIFERIRYLFGIEAM